MRGPATLAMPYIPPISPMKIGRFSRGTVLERIKIAPVNTPAAPSPAIARPTIKAVDVGATPQISDPISKIVRADK